MRLTVTTTVIDDDRALLDLLTSDDALVWVRDGEGLVAWGEACRIDPGTGADRFTAAERALAALAHDAQVDDPLARPGTGLVAVGSFTFDAARAGSLLVVPRVIHGRRGGLRWRTTIDPDGAAPLTAEHLDGARGPDTEPSVPRDRPRYAGSSQEDLDWLEAVAETTRRIGRGDVDKVVLARDHVLWSRDPFAVRPILARLAARFPACHTFLVEGLVGATPELLLAREGEQVRSVVLAGTAARSSDAVDDARLGASLTDSAKDRAEHALALESVTAVLAEHGRALDVPAAPSLLRLANVQHLASAVAAEVDASTGTLALVGALHPTAAVGGSPRAPALAIIAALEDLDRGRYAAPVGWVDARGDGEWGIALRCALIEGDRARLYAGAGIVAGSLPEDELAETQLKLAAMRSVLGDD